MRKGLLAWQWSLYPDGHRDRRNLAIHIVTAPLFWSGCLILVSSPLRPWLALVGAGAMLSTLVLQGRGHRLERAEVVPFLGPLDFVTRFFVEQWVTFPRYVLSGGWYRAWRDAA